MEKLSTHDVETLVIGGGGAGLSAALSLAEMGLSPVILSKLPIYHSHTVAAKGGINAALGNKASDDWRWHYFDTIKGSDYLADGDAVALMCEKAPETILWLEKIGMPFSRDESGKIYQRIYGGQSSDFGLGPPPPRACAAADRTGHALLQTLCQQALRLGVEVIEPVIVVDLLRGENGAVCGVLALHTARGEWQIWRAKRGILIATGGFGQAFATSSAAYSCSGDGGGMILRAGLSLQDMEFVQFHPTGLYGSGLLISEAARAEGGYLLNGLGERFMLREAPNAGDLAARDVIARAMVKEIANGRGCGPKKDHILLSLAHLPAALISERLPSVIQTAQQFARINPLKEAIPVLPTAHYTMGGIPTDISAQVLDQNNQRINGLFAAGEAACSSVHGANRLGCNGLLELLVFGKQAALSIASNNIFANSSALDKQANGLLARYENWLKNENGPAASTTRRNLQKIMSEFCGVERSAEKLKTGIASAQKLFLDAQNFSVREPGLSWNESLREALESENLILQAMACLQAALARDESRGSHWRSDFPDRDDKNWRAHSRVWQKNGEWNFCSSNIRPANDTSLPDMLPENRLY